MLKANGWILAAGMILGGGGRAHGQIGFPGQPPGQPTPEMAEIQRAAELYAFQEKLRSIEARIAKISGSLLRKEIGEETAKEKMLPLIKEQQEIQNDPEFLVEQRLAQARFSSPEYRKKVEKTMRAFTEKQKREKNR